MTAARALCGLLAASASLVLAQAPVPGAPPVPVPSVPGAQNPAMQAPQAAPAPNLGRLFFTPSERATLDEMRRRPVPVAVEEKPLAPPAPEYVTLNGVVRRSDGTTTVWLNNKVVQGQKSSEGLIVTPPRSTAPGNVTVVVPQSGRRVDLKVGQQLEVTSGKVQEPYRNQRPDSAAAGAATADTAQPATAAAPPERPSARRPSRERELLRDLLREIDGPPAGSERSDSAPAAPAPAR